MPTAGGGSCHVVYNTRRFRLGYSNDQWSLEFVDYSDYPETQRPMVFGTYSTFSVGPSEADSRRLWDNRPYLCKRQSIREA